MRLRPHRPFATALASLLLSASGLAQSFQDNTSEIPQGPPFNAALSENVDFADVDLDGDWDAGFADGGDFTKAQNRLWINQGGLQAGTLGVFADETATRCPLVSDQSRDLEFVDFDGDGDADIASANTSSISPTAYGLWVNSGGDQGGSAGFFVDETLPRWAGLGGANSSVWLGLVLIGGGWQEYGSDAEFADVDNDGDLDAIVTSVGQSFDGQIPTRVFLNDGSGTFSEYNSGGLQLTGATISNGDPAPWCEGTQADGTSDATGVFCDVATQAVDADVGDLDGDLDVDLVLLHRDGPARYFQNRSVEDGGTLGFRDVTSALFPPGYSVGGGKYELELGDLDGDDDLDLYGLNWDAGFGDLTLAGAVGGSFSAVQAVASSSFDDEEVDFLDYDGDGDLDAYVAGFAGQDHLYENTGAGGSIALTHAPNALPALTLTSRDLDVADVDGDGDLDVFEANSQRNAYFENLLDVADTFAPRLSLLEQAPDRVASAAPSVVRVQVYDNAPVYVTWYASVDLEYRVGGGPWFPAAMQSSGGQIFRGEIPGALIGTVSYRVRAADETGNTTLSSELTYVSLPSGCTGMPTTYCTSKASSLPGCVPSLSFSGVPSASAGSGFLVTAQPVPGENAGLFVYTTAGALATPVTTPFGFFCVNTGPGLFRIAFQLSPGDQTNCDGSYAVDFNAFYAQQVDDLTLVPGAVVDLQCWYRDPPNAGGANLTEAASFMICP